MFEMSKLEALRAALAQRDQLVVAFSGGVDSAFLLAVATLAAFATANRALGRARVADTVPVSDITSDMA